jgi:glyoxylase-like metal-dependent hydrolase (beta-lactamase superfamily II)
VRLIDVMHLGHERVIGCWQVGDVLVDPGPTSCLPTLLHALGDQRPRALLLTHIHLDHAGASGALVERWPDLEVYVHELGATHMVEPGRLLKSARRLYGPDMDRLWGDMTPVPERNLRVLTGGEMLPGSFEVAYTPGHASHHVSYLHDGTAFVGDVGGVRITPTSLVVPPTPPPDIDIEAWHESIDRIAAWRPRRLAVTHFGDSEDVEAQLEQVGRRLDAWGNLARSRDQAEFIAAIEAEIAAGTEPDWTEAFTQAAPPVQLYAGLTRYWHKRAEALPPASSPPVS